MKMLKRWWRALMYAFPNAPEPARIAFKAVVLLIVLGLLYVVIGQIFQVLTANDIAITE